MISYLRTEPGYYQDGEFGIRLETIVTVVEKKLPVSCQLKLKMRENLLNKIQDFY